MGYGDFKLLSAIGAAGLVATAVDDSVALGGQAAIGISLIVVARRGREVPIPFGPYLAIAGMIALFWGKSLTASYLGLLA
ncbi:MAG: hypothetical protein IPL03_13670 [Sterolibacteriaceae bacterium]|nr:hypothetical protein [Candidatus Methylophosphatis haderslevensis]